MAMPSITRCGSLSMIALFMNDPGSLSSALQMIYFFPAGSRFIRSHLRQTGKPAPPRPRKPESFTCSSTASGVPRSAANKAA